VPRGPGGQADRAAWVRVLSFPLSVVSVALGLGALIVEISDVKWWATTLQLVGVIVAIGGLLYAYLRATQFWDRRFPPIKAWWWRLWGVRKDVTVHVDAATTIFAKATGDVELSYRFHTVTVDDRLDELVGFVNNLLLAKIVPVRNRVGELRHEIDLVRAVAESADKEVFADALAEIKSLTAQLDRQQVLDLRWAAGGLFITAIGLVLSYWA
jgi:hypothetical protein